MQLSIGCIDNPTNIYLFKVKNKNWCEMFSNLTIKTSEQRQLCCNCVSIVNFEHISDLFLIFLLFTWNKQMLAGSPSTEEYIKEWNKFSEQKNCCTKCWKLWGPFSHWKSVTFTIGFSNPKYSTWDSVSRSRCKNIF